MICSPPLMRKDARSEYEQYYLGEKDEDNRKCGEGELHFSGAQVYMHKELDKSHNKYIIIQRK